MNQIYSATEQDPLERYQRDSKKITDKASFFSDPKTTAKTQPETESALPLAAAQNRLALRDEYTYQGLLASRALFEKKIAPEEKEDKLLAHIRDTRFLDTPVLDEWKPRLLDIFRASDTAGFDSLLEEAARRFKPATKDETIRENIAALSSQNPDSLLKQVVRDLKNGALPNLDVERQRVLDLLK